MKLTDHCLTYIQLRRPIGKIGRTVYEENHKMDNPALKSELLFESWDTVFLSNNPFEAFDIFLHMKHVVNDIFNQSVINNDLFILSGNFKLTDRINTFLLTNGIE